LLSSHWNCRSQDGLYGRLLAIISYARGKRHMENPSELLSVELYLLALL
jgi:hypothetical protein